MDYLVYVEDGHCFETDKDDPQALANYESGDMHDGPHCLICDGYWCRNCSPEIFKEKCSAREEPTLPGMEWRQPQIVGIRARRIRI